MTDAAVAVVTTAYNPQTGPNFGVDFTPCVAQLAQQAPQVTFENVYKIHVL